MKKFYTTLALAAAVAISASAANPVATTEKKAMFSRQSASAELVVAAENVKVAKAPAIAKAKPASRDEALGYFPYAHQSLYENGLLEGTLNIYAGEGPNDLVISGLGGTNLVAATFDPATSSISIPIDQVIIPGQQVQEGADVMLVHIQGVQTGTTPEGNPTWNFSDGAEKPQPRTVNTPIKLTFDNEGILTVPESDGWGGRSDKGWYFGNVFFRFSSRMANPSNEGWYDCGQASFTDGWYLHAMKYLLVNEPSFQALDVKLQRNIADPNIYRLYNPYADINEVINAYYGVKPGSENYFGGYNASSLAGTIQFNMTYPSCVAVYPAVYSGLDDLAWNLGLMDMYNSEGAEILVDNEDNEGIPFEQRVLDYKDFHEGENISNYDQATNLVTIYNGLIDFSAEPRAHSWNDLFNLPEVLEMTSYIILPDMSAIDNINVDNSNKVIEYFNLQGIRVENPSNGIYIRRQGNDVQKVYVR